MMRKWKIWVSILTSTREVGVVEKNNNKASTNTVTYEAVHVVVRRKNLYAGIRINKKALIPFCCV